MCKTYIHLNFFKSLIIYLTELLQDDCLLTSTHSVSTLAGGLSGSQLAPTSCDITVRSAEVELSNGLKFWLAM